MTDPHKTHHQLIAQTGITLIEVLITVLILAGGLLGTAVLQSRSLKYNNQAYLNTQANMMAYDMLDRINANKVYSIDGLGYSASLGNMPVTYPTTCEAAPCTPDELAVYDIEQWKFLINEQLPNADGTIQAVDIPEGRNYTITIFFDDSRGEDTRRQIILRSTM